jgi:CCR4-NOT transcription complex subunit 4
VKTDTLKSKEYFGLYGNITKIIMTYKINPNNSKKVYSSNIAYSNDKEAAYAILCVDSLIIQGKILRTFFGTTKYCIYFKNNQVCPNFDKCIFLYQLIII